MGETPCPLVPFGHTLASHSPDLSTALSGASSRKMNTLPLHNLTDAPRGAKTSSALAAFTAVSAACERDLRSSFTDHPLLERKEIDPRMLGGRCFPANESNIVAHDRYGWMTRTIGFNSDSRCCRRQGQPRVFSGVWKYILWGGLRLD